MNEAHNRPADTDVEGYGVFAPIIGPVAVLKMPPPPRPTGGSVGAQEGYSGGSYSGSSDPGALDFGDAPVIHLF